MQIFKRIKSEESIFKMAEYSREDLFKENLKHAQ